MTRPIVALAALAALALLSAGCDPAPCVRRSDCASGLVCSAGACIVPPTDGSTDLDAGDALVSDAPLRDAPDAGDASLDAGALDGGDGGELDASTDAGELDGGDALIDDAGDLDGGDLDAGDLDGGDPDAGDFDGGTDDAGTDDAG